MARGKFVIGERVWNPGCGDGVVVAYSKELETCDVCFDNDTIEYKIFVLRPMQIKHLVPLGYYLSTEEMLTHSCVVLRDYALEKMKADKQVKHD